MKYTKAQVKAITREMRKKFISGEAEGYEIVIALITMGQSGRLDTTGIRDVLLGVYYGNLNGVLRALQSASHIVDKNMISSIMKEVNLIKEK